MYLTTRDLTWSQPYRDDKCTKQLYSVWILPVNYIRIMNRHARRIDPRASDYRVAWDVDSSWITGPMTAHQSVAYVRHIKLAPAANLCTLSAIVFLPIKPWIWRHIFANTSTAAPYFVDCQRTRMTQMTKDFAMRHDESYVEWNGISINDISLWQIVQIIKLYIPSITSVASNFCYDFTIVLPVDCAIKSGPRGCGKLTHNLFLH